jgi:hypothetical protein
VLGERAAYLPAKTSVAVVGELPHGFGKVGLDLGADMDEVALGVPGSRLVIRLPARAFFAKGRGATVQARAGKTGRVKGGRDLMGIQPPS